MSVQPEHALLNLPPHRAPGYYWTTREDAILRATYVAHGAAAVKKLLPWRTLKGISSRAVQMGLRSGAMNRCAGVPPLRWVRTPDIDALINAEYPSCLQRGSVDALAERLGRPSWWVRRTAAHLGLMHPRHKQPLWTWHEDRILEEAPHLQLSALCKRLRAAGFVRSETAVSVRIKRLRVSRVDPDVYSASELAMLMGVAPTTVRRWIDREGLKAARNPESGAAQATWRLHRRDVRQWIRSHVDLVDIRRTDKWWLVELLSEG